MWNCAKEAGFANAAGDEKGNGCQRIGATGQAARRRRPARSAWDVIIVSCCQGVPTHCDERQKDDHHTGTEAERYVHGRVSAR